MINNSFTKKKFLKIKKKNSTKKKYARTHSFLFREEITEEGVTCILLSVSITKKKHQKKKWGLHQLTFDLNHTTLIFVGSNCNSIAEYPRHLSFQMFVMASLKFKSRHDCQKYAHFLLKLTQGSRHFI